LKLSSSFESKVIEENLLSISNLLVLLLNFITCLSFKRKRII
jgi:hypothetical protein